MPKRRPKSIPKASTSRPQQKQVRIPAQHQSGDGRPSWRFSTVDLGGPFPWPKGQPTEAGIVEKLHSFDSMRWSEIKGQEHHFLSPDTLSKAAKDRLETLEREDEIENLFSFRLQGRIRVICIPHNDVAQLLWYDPEHQVSPSHRRHT